jgi:cell division transport system ATP-binding protein
MFEDVYKFYSGGQQALRNVSFNVQAGEFLFINGHSGAGKSTLLKLIAGMERPSRGKVAVMGEDLRTIPVNKLPLLRRHLGLIFQDQKLLMDRSVIANVMLPLLAIGESVQDASKRARAALDKVGLLEREKTYPYALSGGEQQRVAIARAIVNRPSILLADEPTANLDKATAVKILDIFRQFNQVGVTTLIATHDVDLMQPFFPKILKLNQGHLEVSA